jgi:hypothetical protein
MKAENLIKDENILDSDDDESDLKPDRRAVSQNHKFLGRITL